MGAKISAMVLASVLVLVGCSKGGDEAAREAVQTGIDNFNKVQTADYELTLDGKVTMSAEAAGGEAGDVDIKLTLSGVSDNDPEAPKFSMAGEGEAGGMGENVSFDFDVRYVNDKLHFSLGSLEGMNDPLAAGMISSFLGKWWYLPLPSEEMTKYSFQNVPDAELTPEQKQLKDLWEKTELVEEAKVVGDEDLNGTAVTKYSVDLDEEALQEYIEESSKISGQELTKSDVGDMKEFFGLVSFEGEVWIGKDDQTVRKMAGKLSIEDDGSGVTGEFDIAMSFDNLNGDVTVEEPAESQLFDIFSMMGGGAIPGGEVVPDSENPFLNTEIEVIE